MNKRTRRVVRCTVLGVVVAVVVAAAIWRSVRPDATLTVIRPRTETLRACVSEQAVTELPHDQLISMPIAGWLEPITLREGDRVEANEVVARLDTSDLADRVKQIVQQIAALSTRIDKSKDNRLEEGMLVEVNASVKAVDETVKAGERKVEAAKAVADYARYELGRFQKAIKTGTATELELRKAEMAHRKASAEHRSDVFELAAIKTIAAVSHIWPKFVKDYMDLKSYDRTRYRQQIDEAEAALAIAQRNLARARIRTPVAGTVLERLQTRRQFLPAGTPLLTIGRLDDLEVIAEVLTERATRIRRGDPVEIHGKAVGGEPVGGEVLRVYPAGFKKISSLGVEQQRVKVAVKLARRPPRLGVGFRVHVRIYYDQAPDALTVPRTALFRSAGGDWQVIVVEGGRTAVRTVRVGLTSDERAQILSGVAAGDLVAASPSREIAAGMKVQFVEAAP